MHVKCGIRAPELRVSLCFYRFSVRELVSHFKRCTLHLFKPRADLKVYLIGVYLVKCSGRRSLCGCEILFRSRFPIYKHRIHAVGGAFELSTETKDVMTSCDVTSACLQRRNGTFVAVPLCADVDTGSYFGWHLRP